MAPNQHLLVCVIVLLSLRLSSSTTCQPAQKDAILRIQSPIKGFFWNVSEDCCSWNKVACDKSGNVIRLNLDGYTEDNTLLPNSSIFELRFLQNLTLGNDDHGPPIINASIPNEIGRLIELRELIVYGYRGPIPSSIGRLTKLRVLQLISGRLTGRIPPSFGNLRQLTSLALLNNDLSGSIPESFGSLTKLLELVISRNKLIGKLPISIFSLPNLENLSADNNRLEGTIPNKIRPDSKLQFLFLNNNKFTGNAPAWLFTRSLRTVWIQNNRFSGPIESFPSPRVSFLELVDISNNLIEGLPTSLFQLKNVTELTMDGNKISGALDFQLLGEMKRLNTLSMSGNQGLSLKNSRGTFRYPPLLSVILMDRCNLIEFPNFLSSVDSLLRLSINKNKMKGGIDLSKGWKNMWYLDASFNSLGGPLPGATPTLRTLILSHNQFIGKIPNNYCGLTELDLSFNKITACALFKEFCNNGISVVC